MNAREYATLVNEQGRTTVRVRYSQSKQSPLFPRYFCLGEGVDYQDEVFHDAPVKIITSALQGVRRYPLFCGGGYFGQDGIIRNSDFNRASFRPISTSDYSRSDGYHKYHSQSQLGKWNASEETGGRYRWCCACAIVMPALFLFLMPMGTIRRRIPRR